MPTKKPALIAIGVVLLLFGVAFSQSPNIYTFSGDVEITDAPPNDGTAFGLFSSGQHFAASRGDTVYVVWHESRERTSPLGIHVFLAKSTDGGQSFGPNVVVAPGGNPSMKMDENGIIYIAYQSLAGDIYFTKSTDGGNTFTPGVKVNDDTNPEIGQENPAIAVNSKGQIFIAWRDQRTAPGQPHRAVFAAASYDSGMTFTQNIQINDSTTPLGGDIDVGAGDSGRVYVAWKPNDRRIFLSRSDDSGQTFPLRTVATDLPADSTIAGSGSPSIAIGDGVIGVVWQDLRFGQGTIRFSVSHDHGQIFSSSVVVDSSAGQAPSLVWKNGIFYVAWRCYHPRPPDSTLLNLICFSYSPDGGQSFAPFADVIAQKTNLSPFDLHFMGSLAVNEKGRAYAVWFDDRYDPIFEEILHIFGAWGIPTTIKGDLNLDGMLTTVDAVLELNAVFLGQSFSAPFESADSNCDGLLTSPDVVLLLNAIFLENPFPCN